MTDAEARRRAEEIVAGWINSLNMYLTPGQRGDLVDRVADAVAQAVKERDEKLAGRCPHCHGETADRMAAHLQAEVMESERVGQQAEEIARLRAVIANHEEAHRVGLASEKRLRAALGQAISVVEHHVNGYWGAISEWREALRAGRDT